jgi:phage baseplate assembly protein W
MAILPRKPALSTRTGPAFPLAVGPRGYVAFAPDIITLARQEIQQALGTGRGERVMRPTFGSLLPELVFSPADASTCRLAETYARDALVPAIPWCRFSGIAASVPNGQASMIRLLVQYEVIDSGVHDELEYMLPLEQGQ